LQRNRALILLYQSTLIECHGVTFSVIEAVAVEDNVVDVAAAAAAGVEYCPFQGWFELELELEMVEVGVDDDRLDSSVGKY